jgi:hypothetical protein
MSANHHGERVAGLGAAFDEAIGRFITRLERAGAAAAAAPPDGGWSAAQVAWHVALVNESFARLIASGRGAVPAAEGFVEPDWRDIVEGMPSRLNAPSRVTPPDIVDSGEALARLRASAEHMRAAIVALTPERGVMCIHSDIVGTISIYQVAEWATAHAIRHNRQAKRALGE